MVSFAELMRDPRGVILTVVWGAVVAGIWSGIERLTKAVDTIWTEVVMDPFGAIGSSLAELTVALGDAFLAFPDMVSNLATAASSTGLPAPFVTAVVAGIGPIIAAVVLWIVYQALRTATGSIR